MGNYNDVDCICRLCQGLENCPMICYYINMLCNYCMEINIINSMPQIKSLIKTFTCVQVLFIEIFDIQ
jgi:hypothetical protein